MLRPVATIGDSAAVLSLDVDATGLVVGAQLVNNLPGPVAVIVTRPSGRVITASVDPGTTTLTIPAGRRFDYATEAADWGVSLTAPYPG